MVITLTATVEVHGRKATVETSYREDVELTFDETHDVVVELTAQEHFRLLDALAAIGLAPTVKQGEVG